MFYSYIPLYTVNITILKTLMSMMVDRVMLSGAFIKIPKNACGSAPVPGYVNSMEKFSKYWVSIME